MQKFGGSVLQDAQSIRRCAHETMKKHESGYGVIAVVSALGMTTDRLCDLANQVASRPDPKLLDQVLARGEQIASGLLAIAINDLGGDAVSLVGADLGIVTDNQAGNARILHVDRTVYDIHLQAGRIIVAAGYQGVSQDGHLTTLGRGGSDLTAVALAISTNGQPKNGRCEIYRDVDGVYTADPKLIEQAQRLPALSYNSLLNLVNHSEGVVHPRAVDLARRHHLPLHIQHIEATEGGTVVGDATLPDCPSMEQTSLLACTLTENYCRLSVCHLPVDFHNIKPLLDQLTMQEITLRHFETVRIAGGSMLMLTVEQSHREAAAACVGHWLDDIGSGDLSVSSPESRLSLIGQGLLDNPGDIASMTTSLSESDFTVEHFTASSDVCTWYLPSSQAHDALRLIHDHFLIRNSIDIRAASAY